MSKRNYFNTQTGELKGFNREEQLKLGPEWEHVPEVKQWIDEDGMHHFQMIFSDYTVDLVEQELTEEQLQAMKEAENVDGSTD